MKYRKPLAFTCAALIVCVIGYFVLSATGIIQSPTFGSFGPPVKIDPDIYYPVTSVVDGDTFKASVRGKEITVRVLGINTPETVDPRKPVECYGPEASAEAKRSLTDRKVELKQNPDREARDRYGRYLAYVYRDDGLFYNEYMIENGYAREYTYGTAYSLQSEFKGIEKKAQKEGKGLWGKCLK